MSKENILFDDVVMRAELERILQHIENDDPVPSHVWLMIKHPGIEEGQWTTDNLYDFLSLLVTPDSGANAYAVWSNVADKVPSMEADEIIGNQNILEGTTGVNITDLILAVAKSLAIIQDYAHVFMSLVMGPWWFVVENEPDVQNRINSLTMRLIEKLIEPEVYSDKKAMKKEYDRIFDVLLKGDVALSHWCLSVKYNGDTGGNVWTPERLRAYLQAIMDTDEGNDMKFTWLITPAETLDCIDNNVLVSKTGEPLATLPDYATWSSINLSTLIRLGCQQDDIVNSPLVGTFIMLILYPFRVCVMNNTGDWIANTRDLILRTHQVLKNHTTH